MVWLLTEILVYVAAAAVFGAVIGVGLAGTGSKRRVVAFEREHQNLIRKLETAERALRAAEGAVVARGAAEAAARGDLELRLVEMEQAAADYRARAEAAERRVHLMQTPGTAPALVEAESPAASEASDGDVSGAPALGFDGTEARLLEIASLKAQLALAERVRARAEIDLAVAHARPEAMRAVWPASAASGTASAIAAEISLDGEKPQGVAAPRDGKPDDLRRIRGIGPKNEGVLNALGIYHYEQVAAFTPANVAWLDAFLKYHGRIARDDWVGQAKALLGPEGQPADKVHPQDAGL